ncbi:MAG TPA: DUF1365 domain-containing protein, partial [Pseudonocardiaceae bacterium]
MVTPALYDGVVTHVRRQAPRHSFDHRIYLWLVDIDHLPDLPRWLRPFAGFRAEDHIGSAERSIRENVDAWLATQDIDLHGGQVLMLANARVLGYVFNPITVYWCHQPDGSLECVVAEVHNTYGEQHRYLLRPDDAGRAETAKEFYVSPFYPVDGSYRMRVPEPGAELSITITLHRPDERPFTATVRGVRRPATRRALLG